MKLMTCNQLVKVSFVQLKQQRTKDRVLWNAVEDDSVVKLDPTVTNTLLMICEV